MKNELKKKEKQRNWVREQEKERIQIKKVRSETETRKERTKDRKKIGEKEIENASIVILQLSDVLLNYSLPKESCSQWKKVTETLKVVACLFLI
jgi:iron-sulfur cluster repair protein YtfE (RIC family)